MRLVITADDYGYSPAIDRGIAEAAASRAIDAVSAMVLRGSLDPSALDESGVGVGLHLELGEVALADQVDLFEETFGREPTHLDGHHHCHASGRPAVEVANLARERGWAVRSVDERHRRLLRCKGLRTADRLVGRIGEDEPVLPVEIEELIAGVDTGDQVLEWVVHPGHADPSAESSYDAGREQDLRVLLELADEPALRAIRGGWR
ncbi:MAG: ChbG/HpnK family deacetylase [Solirubrobacterales bacterium]